MSTHRLNYVVLDLSVLRGASAADLARDLRECNYPAIADQIAAQIRLRRIPEPGLWGVVASNGRNYVHTTIEGVWRSGDYTAKWDDIADGAILVREGIES